MREFHIHANLTKCVKPCGDFKPLNCTYLLHLTLGEVARQKHMIPPSYEQNTAKLGEIHGTVNLGFTRPVHEGYRAATFATFDGLGEGLGAGVWSLPLGGGGASGSTTTTSGPHFVCFPGLPPLGA